MRRKQAFVYLLADTSFSSDSKEMSQRELEMISSIADTSSQEGLRFWATAHLIQVLSEWGVETSVWLHGCMCTHHASDRERAVCKLKGRRAVQVASGQWKEFIRRLSSLSISQDAVAALSKLEQLDSGYAKFLLQSFQDCRASMEFKAKQSWSFWDSLPFSVLQLLRHWVDPVQEDWSRETAKRLMSLYDAAPSKTSMGAVSFQIFGSGGRYREMLQAWIDGGGLADPLKQLLVGYSTALVVMQRLEARHHLVNLALTRGRANSPAAVMANLRRRLNGDVHEPSFRDELELLLSRFGDLVVDEWESHKQLIEIVYGFGLEQLHPDMYFEQRELQLQSALEDVAPAAVIQGCPTSTGNSVLASWLV